VQQDLPDLALLDIQISGDIDGVDLAEIIRDSLTSFFYFLPRPMRTMKPCFVLRDKVHWLLGKKPYMVKVNAAIQITKTLFCRLKTAEGSYKHIKIVDSLFFLKVDSKLIKVKSRIFSS
jgi:hypothetical protein